MMDGDAMKALIKQIDQGTGVKTRYEILPGGFHYMAVDKDGEITHAEMPSNPLIAKAYTPEAIYAFLSHYDSITHYQVFYGRNGITAYTTVRDTIRMSLNYNQAFKMLMSGPLNLNQRDLYRHLRTTFAGMVDSSLITKICKVDIKKAADTTAAIARGSVSLTKSMVATAAGTTELPDVVSFNLPTIWESTYGIATVVKCDFDLDPQTEVFTLTPLPGVIESAQYNHEVYLANILGEAAKAYELEPNLVCGTF
jgi:hypothetical protein